MPEKEKGTAAEFPSLSPYHLLIAPYGVGGSATTAVMEVCPYAVCIVNVIVLPISDLAVANALSAIVIEPGAAVIEDGDMIAVVVVPETS